jgi:hypothetical protein
MIYRIWTLFFLFFKLTLQSQIHFIGEVKDNKGNPLKNITIVFGNNSQKCLSNMYGVVECDLNYSGGEEISIRVEPTGYLLSVDNQITIKKNYEAKPLRIVVMKNGAEKITNSSINASVLAAINDLTKTFIENAPDRVSKEKAQSEVISDAVNHKLVSLNQLLQMKSEAAFAGIAYYIMEYPDIKYFKYIKFSYNLLLRNFTRYAYSKALIELMKGKSLDSLEIFSNDIKAITKVFEDEGDNSVKEKCHELKDYLGLNQGWNENCKCYRFNDTKIKFELVNRNVTDENFMKPYYISMPLKDDIFIQLINLNEGIYPHTATLVPGTLLDSLDWRNYQKLAESLPGLSMPTFFEIINSDLFGAIELDTSSAVFTNCHVQMPEGIWPLCFIRKTKASFDDLRKSNYLYRWRKEYELKKNDFNYYGIQVDPTLMWIQPDDGSIRGRDIYKGPFYFVKKIHE